MIDLDKEKKIFITYMLFYFSLSKLKGITYFLSNPGINIFEYFKLLKSILIDFKLLNNYTISFEKSLLKDNLNVNIIEFDNFFINNEFLSWDEKDLGLIAFKIKDECKKEIEEKYNNFMDNVYINYYQSSFFQIDKNIMFDKLEKLFDLHGDEFEISTDNFENKNIHFIQLLISFIKLGFIEIKGVNNNVRDDYYFLGFNIKLTEKVIELIKNIQELKYMILDKIFDEEYKSLTILHEGGKIKIHSIKNLSGEEGIKTLSIDKNNYDYKVISSIKLSTDVKENDIFLDKSNGTVYLLGEKIGKIKYNTQEYKFFEYLYNNKGKALSHKEIINYVNPDSKYEKTANAYLSDIKARLPKEIKKLIKSPNLHYLLP